MFDLGMQELIVIFVVALLVFGPKRLPELGRTIGKVMGQIRNVMSDVKSEVDREIHLAEKELDISDLPAWKKRPTEEELQDVGPKVTQEDIEKAKKALQDEKKAQQEAAKAAQDEKEGEDYREIMPDEVEDSPDDIEDEKAHEG